jgi:predicted negative regulator of RcsB-dependent stress response
VRTEVRHRLKEDPFAEKTKEVFSWAAEHSINLIGGVLIAGVIIGASLGWWYHTTQRNQQANAELGQAMETMNAPISAQPIPGYTEIYATSQQRAQAAEKKFDAIAAQYGSSKPAEMARYFAGVARVQAGDDPGAEQTLKPLADSHQADVASLAKMALASLYASSGREPQAIVIYKGLIDHPTETVSKGEAQLQLAALYTTSQPEEAAKIYQEMQKSDPTGPVGELAQSKLTEIKK